MRKTKIVATLGPACDDPAVLRELLAAGLDVARFNFSHGTYDEHRKRVETLRKVCEETGNMVALLADTKGPEIRLGLFEGGKAELVAGETFVLTSEQVTGTAARATVSYAGLPHEVVPGETRILIADGLIELKVESVSGNDITTRVVNGGKISDRKGMNVPNGKLKLPYMSEKDLSDLAFFVEMGFDAISASFTRSADDVKAMRAELARLDPDNKLRIIAKIENADGVHNAEAILEVADGLMVARGDLGVEVPLEDLPLIQKDLIKKALYLGKDVVTATQMLESMTNNPRPTRAETSDVANAVFDGTGAIMLSGETAAGKYPIEAVKTMAKIAKRIEEGIDYRERFIASHHKPHPSSVTNAIAHATVTAAHELNATAILTVTMTGHTARAVMKYRPLCPIIACTPNPTVARQMRLTWGVEPLLTDHCADATSIFQNAIGKAVAEGHLKKGDLVVLTAGIPVGKAGTTNMLHIHIVGEEIYL